MAIGATQYMLAHLSEGREEWALMCWPSSCALIYTSCFFIVTFYHSNFYIFLLPLFSFHDMEQGQMLLKWHISLFLYIYHCFLFINDFFVLYRWILFIFFKSMQPYAKLLSIHCIFQRTGGRKEFRDISENSCIIYLNLLRLQ